MRTYGQTGKDQRVPTAAIYTRVSTQEQAAEDKVSLEVQERECRDYCEHRGYAVTALLCDDGYSGDDPARPAFRQLLAGLQEHVWSVAVVREPTRLTRGFGPAGLLEDAWRKGRYRRLPVEGAARAVDPSIWPLQVGINVWDRDNFKERMAAAKRGYAQRGRYVGGAIPYGFRLDRERKVWLEDPDRARWVRRIFELVAHEGLTTYQIAAWLDRQGVPTPKGGAHWSQKTVWGILRHPAHKGRHQALRPCGEEPWYEPGEEWIEQEVPVLVSAELWEAAQAALAVNRHTIKRTTAVHQLSGFLYCGECDRKLHRRYNGSTVPVYACPTRADHRLRQRTGAPCGSARVPARWLDALVLDRLRGYLEREGGLEGLARDLLATLTRSREEIAAQVGDLPGRLAKLDDLRERATHIYKLGEWNRAQYLERLQELRQEEERIHKVKASSSRLLEELARLDGDRAAIERALGSGRLRVAVEFPPAGGRVFLEAHRDGTVEELPPGEALVTHEIKETAADGGEGGAGGGELRSITWWESAVGLAHLLRQIAFAGYVHQDRVEFRALIPVEAVPLEEAGAARKGRRGGGGPSGGETDRKGGRSGDMWDGGRSVVPPTFLA